MVNNPLSINYSETEDVELLKKSLDGNKAALNELIQIHQPFIYNVAWKMAHDPNDAWDLTQETLLIVVTKLSQFSFKSSFRTWLYRIVVNEFLKSKRRKGEEQFSSFEDYAARLNALPNPDLNKAEELELKELATEMKIRCTSGMVMCLNREQRLIFILGEMFGVDHKLGAEIFDISPQNFRVKLHRARKDLYNYMNNNCGLVNLDNPCRCPKKAKVLKAKGVLEESKMLFNTHYQKKIAHYAGQVYHEIEDLINERYVEVFQGHPFKNEFDKKSLIDEFLKDEDFTKYFNPLGTYLT